MNRAKPGKKKPGSLGKRIRVFVVSNRVQAVCRGFPAAARTFSLLLPAAVFLLQAERFDLIQILLPDLVLGEIDQEISGLFL